MCFQPKHTLMYSFQIFKNQPSQNGCFFCEILNIFFQKRHLRMFFSEFVIWNIFLSPFSKLNFLQCQRIKDVNIRKSNFVLIWILIKGTVDIEKRQLCCSNFVVLCPLLLFFFYLELLITFRLERLYHFWTGLYNFFSRLLFDHFPRKSQNKRLRYLHTFSL